jgi:hypothetical protein
MQLRSTQTARCAGTAGACNGTSAGTGDRGLRHRLDNHERGRIMVNWLLNLVLDLAFGKQEQIERKTDRRT